MSDKSALKSWASEIINEMYGMCEVFGIDEERKTLRLMCNRIKDPSLTYGQRLLNMIRDGGYINTHVELSLNNKKTSISKIKNADPNSYAGFSKYVNSALRGKYYPICFL